MLAANGMSFSAGADLNRMQRTAGYPGANLKDAMALAELMRTLNGLAMPTVARVQGSLAAAGVVACCDIAIAARTAIAVVSEVRIAIPAVISP